MSDEEICGIIVVEVVVVIKEEITELSGSFKPC